MGGGGSAVLTQKQGRTGNIAARVIAGALRVAVYIFAAHVHFAVALLQRRIPARRGFGFK